MFHKSLKAKIWLYKKSNSECLETQEPEEGNHKRFKNDLKKLAKALTKRRRGQPGPVMVKSRQTVADDTSRSSRKFSLLLRHTLCWEKLEMMTRTKLVKDNHLPSMVKS